MTRTPLKIQPPCIKEINNEIGLIVFEACEVIDPNDGMQRIKVFNFETNGLMGASFSLQAMQDIGAMHGIDIETELNDVLDYELRAEMNMDKTFYENLNLSDKLERLGL